MIGGKREAPPITDGFEILRKKVKKVEPQKEMNDTVNQAYSFIERTRMKMLNNKKQ